MWFIQTDASCPDHIPVPRMGTPVGIPGWRQQAEPSPPRPRRALQALSCTSPGQLTRALPGYVLGPPSSICRTQITVPRYPAEGRGAWCEDSS